MTWEATIGYLLLIVGVLGMAVSLGFALVTAYRKRR